MKVFRIFEDITPALAKDFVDCVGSAQEDEQIQLEILSYGGEIFSGLAMAQLIREAHARGIESTATIFGLAASAAAILALACDRVVMAESGVLMLHGVWRENGEQDEGIERANAGCLAIIQRRCPSYTLEQLVEGDHWYSAEEAKALGLADEIKNLGSNDSALAALRAAGRVLRAQARFGGKMKHKNETEELVIETDAQESTEERQEDVDLKTLVIDGFNAVFTRLDKIDEQIKALKLEAQEPVQTEEQADIMSAKIRAMYDRIGQVSGPCVRPVQDEKNEAKAACERAKAVFPNIAKYYHE